MLLLLAVATMLVCGLIGSSIAPPRGLSGLAGFLIGGFFGPVGLLILAVARPADRVIVRGRFSGDRDLASEPYQLWLTRKYNISRNEVFDRYTVGGEMFQSLDGALAHANHQENNDVDRIKADKRRLLMSFGLVCLLSLVIVVSCAIYIKINEQISHRNAVDQAASAYRIEVEKVTAAFASVGLKPPSQVFYEGADFRNKSTGELVGINNNPSNSIMRISSTSYDCSLAGDTGSGLRDEGGTVVNMFSHAPINQIESELRNEITSRGWIATHKWDLHGLIPTQYPISEAYIKNNRIIFLFATSEMLQVCLEDRGIMENMLKTVDSLNKNTIEERKYDTNLEQQNREVARKLKEYDDRSMKEAEKIYKDSLQ